MDFGADDEDYDETLEQWEFAIANDTANYTEEILSQFDIYEMYVYYY